jgi:hypothetical protein
MSTALPEKPPVEEKDFLRKDYEPLSDAWHRLERPVATTGVDARWKHACIHGEPEGFTP